MNRDVVTSLAAGAASMKITRGEACTIGGGQHARNGLNLPVNAWYNSRTLTRWRLVEACQPHF